MASGTTVQERLWERAVDRKGKGGLRGLGFGAWVLDADAARSLAKLGRTCLAYSPLRNPVLSLLDRPPAS